MCQLPPWYCSVPTTDGTTKELLADHAHTLSDHKLESKRKLSEMASRQAGSMHVCLRNTETQILRGRGSCSATKKEHV